MKVQQNSRSAQYFVTLPKKICEALSIKKGDELKVFVERGDLILRKE